VSITVAGGCFGSLTIFATKSAPPAGAFAMVMTLQPGFNPRRRAHPQAISKTQIQRRLVAGRFPAHPLSGVENRNEFNYSVYCTPSCGCQFIYLERQSITSAAKTKAVSLGSMRLLL
jgi:hypothetical protein